MKTSTMQSVNWILEDEGPEFNRSAGEPGGGSKFGVSLTAYREAGRPNFTLDQLGALTKVDAMAFYSATILPQIRFDELPVGIDYRVADIRVNLGQTGCINLLELCAGFWWPLTGKLDERLLQAVHAEEPGALILALSAAWLAKKHESPNWGPSPQTKTGYGHGWWNRDQRAFKRALGMLGR